MRDDLSQDFLDELERPGCAPFQIAIFKFASGDRYLSDRKFEYAPGLFTEPLIESWGTLNRTSSTAETLAGSGIPVSVQTLTIINLGPDWFSALFNTESPEGIEVEIWQHFKDIPDNYLIDSFIIQDNFSHSQSALTVSVDLVSKIVSSGQYVGKLDPISNTYAGVVLSSASGILGVPAGAHPVAYLDDSITDDITTIKTTAGNLSSLGFPPSGYILISFEKVSYTSFSGGTFLGCTRGVGTPDNPPAYAHPDKTPVTLFGHEYLYNFSSGPVEDIIDVSLDGIPYQFDYNKYIYQDIVQLGFVNHPPYTVSTSTIESISYDRLVGAITDATGRNEQPGTGDMGTCIGSTDKVWIFRHSLGDVDGDIIGSYIITIPQLPQWVLKTTDFESIIFYRFDLGCSRPTSVIQGTRVTHNQEDVFLFYDTGINIGEYLIDNIELEYPDNGLEVIFDAVVQYVGDTATQSGTLAVNVLCGFRDYSYTPLDIKIGGDITATVTAASSDNCADVIEQMALKIGLTFDQPSLDDARVWFSDNGYAFRGLVPGSQTLMQTLVDMCNQCKSMIYSRAGILHLLVKQNITDFPAVQHYLSETSDDVSKNSIAGSSQRSSDLLNTIDVRYDAADIQAGYQQSFTISDAPSVSKYGKQQDTLDMYLVTDSAMAQDVAGFVLEDRKKPYTILTFRGYLKAFPLEIGDVVALHTRYSKYIYFKGRVINTGRAYGSWKTKQIDYHEIVIAGYPTPTESISSINLADGMRILDGGTEKI